jgi:phosphoglycerol transferase MdoB-like AlkP superfamily enzyme
VIIDTFQNIVQKNLRYFFTFVVLLWLLRIFEFTQIELVGEGSPKLSYLFSGMLIDVLIALVVFGVSLIVQYLITLIKFNRQVIFPVLIIIYLIINLGTIIYFGESKVVLDESLFFFSLEELAIITNGVHGVPVITYILLVVILFISAVLVKWFSRINFSKKGSVIFGILALTSIFFMSFTDYFSRKRVANTYVNNRGAFFIWRSFVYFNTNNAEINQMYKTSDFQDLNESFFATKSEREDFPLLHKLPEKEKFGSYFNRSELGPPNIVLIIVEGLNSDFIGDYAKSTGDAMPFLDSLRKESLYFPNFISTCQRTFNVLPAIMASVPNSTDGKYTMMNKFTPQMGLPNILKSNFHSSFSCGVDLRFTDMDKYMSGLKIDYLVDNWEKKFDSPFNNYERIWGYPDGYLFEKSLLDREKNKKVEKSRLEVLLTISTHGPYAFPDQDGYEKRAFEKLKKNPISKEMKNQIYREEFMMSSYTYTDDEFRKYFAKARQLEEFKNTIFLITGDHGTPFYSRNALSNFNVPLIIYSDLLKAPKTFKAVSTHLDIAPTLLNYLRLEYGIAIPEKVSFIGKGLDLTEKFRNRNTLPFLSVNGKNEAVLDGLNLYINGEMYRINSDFTPKKTNDQQKADYYQKQLILYEKMSRYVFNQNNIVPLPIYTKMIGEDDYKILFDKVYPKLTQKKSTTYYNFMPITKIPKGIRKIKIDVELEVKVSSMKEFKELPEFIASASNKGATDELVFWEFATAQIYGKFQPNHYNRISYQMEIDLSKAPKIKEEHEFAAFLYNLEQKNLEIRKVKILVMGGE